jgi:hypothetical protein
VLDPGCRRRKDSIRPKVKAPTRKRFLASKPFRKRKKASRPTDATAMMVNEFWFMKDISTPTGSTNFIIGECRLVYGYFDYTGTIADIHGITFKKWP